MLSQQVGTQAKSLDVSNVTRINTALFALAFGSFLFYFTAFSHSEILHNAAHDTRHAITSPCH